VVLRDEEGYLPEVLEVLEAGELPAHPPPGWKIVCAWCDSLIRGDPDAKIESHGFCKRCSEEYLKRWEDGTEPPGEPF
jgi:hypothetical protein